MKDENKKSDFLNLANLFDGLSKFIELKMEIYQLKLKEQLVIIISSIAALTLILSFGLFVLFFLSLALGSYLNGVLKSDFLGFGIIAILYLILGVILVLSRNKLITNHLFQAFFSDTLTQSSDEQDENSEDEDLRED